MNESKYRTLVETLKRNILSGKYGAQTPLPSVRALIGRFGYSKTTVQRALDELCYQGLVFRRQGSGTFLTCAAISRKIGLIVPDHGRSEFFPAIAREVSRLAQESNYTLCFGEITAANGSGRVRQLENLVRDFVDQRVSGVVFQPIDYIRNGDVVNLRVLRAFDEACIPVVLCDYDVVEAPSRSAYDVVGINNVEAGTMMAEHLVGAGVRKFAFHLLPFAPRSQRDYVRGARLAAMAKGCAERVLVSDPDDTGALRRFLRRGRPDVVVCGNDSSAARLNKTLARIGLVVPRDILLTGVNDLQIASLLTPSLTTIHLPCEQIAAAAFERLLARIARPGLPPVETFLPVRLVSRESTKRISKGG